MHNVKIISLKEPFTDEFNGVLCVSCMSYIIALIFGHSQHRKTHQALYRWKEGVALNSICIVNWGKTLSLCGVNSFIFSFSFWLTEVRIDLVCTSTILLHVRLVPKIQPAPCYIPKIQISCSQNWCLHNPRLAIPKLQCARKLPPAAKSRHAKSPF